MANNLDWSIEKLKELDQKYMKEVIKNLREDKRSVVQFGETGIGFKPHYQITYSNSVKRTVSGLSHKNFDTKELSLIHEEFNPENISKKFSYEEVNSLH